MFSYGEQWSVLLSTNNRRSWLNVRKDRSKDGLVMCHLLSLLMQYKPYMGTYVVIYGMSLVKYLFSLSNLPKDYLELEANLLNSPMVDTEK